MSQDRRWVSAPSSKPKAVRQYPGPGSSVFRFFLLTYALTWTCWIPVVLVPNFPRTLGYALWLVGTFAPSIIALLLTWRAEGETGVAALLSRLFQWQVGARWYVFAIAYIVVVKLAAALLHHVALGTWPRLGSELPAVMLVATLISTPVQSGEEIGWRGYALPPAGPHHGIRASLRCCSEWCGRAGICRNSSLSRPILTNSRSQSGLCRL